MRKWKGGGGGGDNCKGSGRNRKKVDRSKIDCRARIILVTFEFRRVNLCFSQLGEERLEQINERRFSESFLMVELFSSPYRRRREKIVTIFFAKQNKIFTSCIAT